MLFRVGKVANPTCQTSWQSTVNVISERHRWNWATVRVRRSESMDGRYTIHRVSIRVGGTFLEVSGAAKTGCAQVLFRRQSNDISL